MIQYSLSTLWIEDIPDSDNLRCAFNIFTPEEHFALAANNEIDKEDWMSAILLAISALVESEDSHCVTMKAGSLTSNISRFTSLNFLRQGPPKLSLPKFRQQSQLRRRIAKHAFNSHPFYKYALVSKISRYLTMTTHA